jgi:hypothetical protein
VIDSYYPRTGTVTPPEPPPGTCFPGGQYDPGPCSETEVLAGLTFVVRCAAHGHCTYWRNVDGSVIVEDDR